MPKHNGRKGLSTGSLRGGALMDDMRESGRTENWLRRTLFFFLLFALIVEWILPLTAMAQLTELYRVNPIIFAVGCFFVIDFTRMPSSLGWPLKALAGLAVVAHLFHHLSLLDLTWWRQYREILISDGALLLQGQWNMLSGQNRTFLFLMGWALMISVVQSIIFHKHRGLWFVLATMLYLIGLQLWPGIDTSTNLVRTFVTGILFVSLLNLPRIEQRYRISARIIGWPLMWVIACVLLAASSTAMGLYFSEAQSKEIRPLNWQYYFDGIAYRGNTEPSAVHSDQPLLSKSILTARSGYGSDDSRLGGGIERDNEAVFLARTDRLTYWRGESKNVYTGKGWIQRKSDIWLGNVNEPLPENILGEDTAPRKTMTQELLLNGNRGEAPFFSGGTISQVEAVLTGEAHSIADSQIGIDAAAGKYSLIPAESSISYYRLKVETIDWNEEELRRAQGVDPPVVETMNLQLPDELPQRVRGLAERLVEGTTNRYDSAKAIEAYLRSSYSYSLSEPVYPPEGQDFTDHFLFDQKLGYCDHFSTAMVVLLRSVGIPARWVKGYAPGELSPSAELLTGGNPDPLQESSAPEGANPSAESSRTQPNPSVKAVVTGEAAGGADMPPLKPEAANSTAADDATGDSRSQGESFTVMVRNLHAHSWVEVYFPQTGWVAFEPTPGFSGHTAERQMREEAEKALPAQTLAAETGADEQPVKDPGAGVKEKLASHVRQAVQAASNLWSKVDKFLVGMAFLALFFIALALWKLREQLYVWFVMRGHSRSRQDPDALVRILDRMWQKLFDQYGPIRQQQTMREYVSSLQISEERRLKALVHFSQVYESVRYGSIHRPWLSKKQLAEMWGSLRQ